ncbi:MAG: DUF177 domain-containing protein [Pseudomonadota bacterium]
MEPSEFSRVFDLTTANEHAVEVSHQARASETTALAKRFDVRGLEALAALLAVTPHALGYQVTGEVKAKVHQTCCVSGEPLESQAKASINFLAISAEIDIDLDSVEDAYKVTEAALVHSHEIDLGELAAQYLGLAIDPFPRKDGAELDKGVAGEKQNPFAVLAQLKDKA